jgi:hypothetical protein
MALIKNQIIGQAVRAEFPTQTVLLQLGALATNTDLVGKGTGDTVKFTKFSTISEGLQELNRGDVITYEDIAQTGDEVTVKQYAKGIRIFDQDVQFSVSGGSLEAVAGEQLTTAFARALDAAAMQTLLTSVKPVIDATAGLTADLILKHILKEFGENALEEAGAILVPSLVASQLLINEQSNIVKASANGYTATYRNEVGRLFDQLPIVMSDRVVSEVVGADTIYKTIVVPKNSLVYALAKDVNVEQSRVSAERATYIDADIFYALKLLKDPIVFNTKASV